jgi:glycosyltransferase involved in cell wall biosynthesis
MTRPRTNICLNMIVKNEEKVLPRLFKTVSDAIDYYVIVDTGSTDGTISLIRREMEARGIPGEIHERPWVNFAANRQQALDLAIQANKTEWALFIDADEELGISDPKFYEKFEAGITYDIEIHNGPIRYVVPHIANLRKGKLRWEGVVHNYLVVEGGTRRLTKDVWVVYHSGEGAKSHGLTREEKYLRDARILEAELAKDPTNTRNQFLLGRSYRDAEHHEKAQEEYRKRVQMDGWAEEKFMAQLEVGRISIHLDKRTDIVLSELLDAYNLRPTRAEPLYELARYFFKKKMYPMATLFAKAGVQTPRPSDHLYVNEGVYAWRMLDELAVSTFWVGDYKASRDACAKILELVAGGLSLNDDDLKRVRSNLDGAERKLASGAT